MLKTARGPGGDFRTLFVLAERAPLRTLVEVAEGATVTGSDDELEVSFPDGGRIVATQSDERAPGNSVSKAVLGALALFRGVALPRDTSARRERILGRIRLTRRLIGVRGASGFSHDALQFVFATAKRCEALVFDGESLVDCAGTCLLNRKGHVATDIPSAWAAPVARVASPAPRAPGGWVNAPVLVSHETPTRARELLGLRDPTETYAKLPGGARLAMDVFDEISSPRELASTVVDLRSAVLKGRMPKESDERRAKVTRFLTAAPVLVQTRPGVESHIDAGDWLAEMAKRTHALVIRDSSCFDEQGKLALSSSGQFDPSAMSPRQVLILGQNIGADTPTQATSRADLEVEAVELPGHYERSIEGSLYAFRVASGLGRKGAKRRAALAPLLGVTSAVKVSTEAPFDLSQIRILLGIAKGMRGVVFDGWAVYDSSGRALLTRDGRIDPSAVIPG